MLALTRVSRHIDGRAVVSEVSLSVAAGEVVALLGPSGSGKTSLLRLVAGFDAPSAGELQLHGQAASRAGRVLLPPERRQMALAFQDATLFPHLDAVDNAAFALRHLPAAERRARAREALAAMGLQAMEGRDVATLSGGEAQRVSLARALAAQARLLLLDEPFANVDRLTRADLLARLKARLQGTAGAERPAAIVVTHDPADALELGARVLLMREGRLVVDAQAESIVRGDHGDWARAVMTAG